MPFCDLINLQKSCVMLNCVKVMIVCGGIMFQVETDSVRTLYKRSLELDCTLKELDCELRRLQIKKIKLEIKQLETHISVCELYLTMLHFSMNTIYEYLFMQLSCSFSLP